MPTSPGAGQAAKADAPHVGIFLSSLGVRGRERTLLALAGALVARGSRVDLLLPRPTPELVRQVPRGVRLVDLERWWMRIPGLGARNKGRIYLSPPALAGYLRRSAPDLLLTGSIPPSLAALVARRMARGSTRIVLRQSNVVRVPGSPRYGDVRARPRDVLIPRLYPGADAVIAVSEGVAENLRELAGLSAERVFVVPNRNVPEDLAERASEPLDHPWFRRGEPPVVLAVARFVAKKDHATLLRAFRRLRDKTEARLVLLGRDGPERPAVAAQLRQLGLERDVALPGFDPNPFRYMARAAVFALSSVSEGMPNALVEALACGCPVVSTDCPSGPAEILEGGRFGRLVPVGDDCALADALLRTIEAPPKREELRARGAAFGVDRAVDAYLEILLEVAEEGT
jgi:glycosyltransferase involved in cell wall biosynthesis